MTAKKQKKINSAQTTEPSAQPINETKAVKTKKPTAITEFDEKFNFATFNSLWKEAKKHKDKKRKEEPIPVRRITKVKR